MLKQISTQNQKGGGADDAKSEIERQGGEKHSSPLLLRRLAKLRQRVGRCTGKPEIEKAEIAKQNPHDRNHAIAGIAHMADVYWNGYERNRNPRHWRQQIDGETRLKRLSRHNTCDPRYPSRAHPLCRARFHLPERPVIDLPQLRFFAKSARNQRNRDLNNAL